MRYYTGLLILFVFLYSCGDPSTRIQKKQNPVQDIVLSDADIYNGVKVNQFLNNKKKFISESNQLFLKGTDAFKNKGNADSAIVYFKRSILKEPTSKAYYELGNAFKTKKNFDDAIASYKLAEQLDYQPFYNILYSMSQVYTQKGDLEMAGQYLLYALQAGFYDLDKMDDDDELTALREDWRFKNIVSEGIRGMSSPETIAWLRFKKQFSKVSVPITLSVDLNEDQLNELSFISYDFERFISEMRDEKFSREVSKGFYYYAQPYETDKYVAVVYIIRDEFMGEYAPNLYRLATFTHEGKLIDKKEIAGGSELMGEMMDATLLAGGKIELKIFEPIFEKDPEEHGFWDNPMTGKKQLRKEYLKIDTNGKILEGSQDALSAK